MKKHQPSEITHLSEQIVRLIDAEANGNFYLLRDTQSSLTQQAWDLSKRVAAVATKVIRQDHDPFLDQYAWEQEKLHNLITGRSTRETRETTPGEDLTDALWHANPYAWEDHDFIAKYQYLTACTTRVLSGAIKKTPLKILDMGCGRGLTTEILAQTGAHVTGFDIDPKWTSFSEGRARIRGFKITRVIGEFDHVSSCSPALDQYDLILFCASLHHSAKPWLLLERLTKHLEHEGMIAFIEEPVNQIWWKHWGLRLDPESIYVMAKFGWFESGWSLEFIHAMAERLKLEFKCFGNQNNDQVGIFTSSSQHLNTLTQNIIRFGFEPLCVPTGEATQPLRNFAAQLSSEEEQYSAPADSLLHYVVTVANQSDEPWRRNSEFPVNLSYHWRRLDGEYAIYDGERTPLPRNEIKPGQIFSCIANIKTPEKPGKYQLIITLVQEQVAWFEDKGFKPLHYVMEIS